MKKILKIREIGIKYLDCVHYDMWNKSVSEFSNKFSRVQRAKKYKTDKQPKRSFIEMCKKEIKIVAIAILNIFI